MAKTIKLTIPFNYLDFEKSIWTFLQNIKKTDMNFKNEEIIIVFGNELKVADPTDALREILLLELVKVHIADLQQGSDFTPLC